MISFVHYGQTEIDQLNSDSLVKEYVVKRNYSDKNFEWAYFEFHETLQDSLWKSRFRNRELSSLRNKKWIKRDFNRDGKTDLMVCGVTKRPQRKYFDYKYRNIVKEQSGPVPHTLSLLLSLYLESLSIAPNEK